MAIEFDTINDLETWVKMNTTVNDGKWFLSGVNKAIQQARQDGVRIFAEMRREAKALKIPDNIVNTDLISFADEFCVNDEGEIRSHDGTHTIQTLLGKEQADRPHWHEEKPKPTPTAAPKPGSLAALFES